MNNLSRFLRRIQWVWVAMIYYVLAVVAALILAGYTLWLNHPWWMVALVLAAVLIIALDIWVESTGE